MPIYLHTEIKVKPDGLLALSRLIQDYLKPIMGGQGWTLVSSVKSQGEDKTVTVFNLWHLPDQDAFGKGVAALRAHSSYSRTLSLREQCIIHETMSLSHEWLEPSKI